MHFVIDSERRAISLFASPGLTGVGHSYVGQIRDLDLEANVTVGVTLFLTEKQKVFAKLAGPFQFMMGPMFVGKSGSAKYYPVVGLPKSFYVNLDSRRFELVGTSNNTIHSVLSGTSEIIPHY